MYYKLVFLLSDRVTADDFKVKQYVLAPSKSLEKAHLLNFCVISTDFIVNQYLVVPTIFVG